MNLSQRNIEVIALTLLMTSLSVSVLPTLSMRIDMAAMLNAMVNSVGSVWNKAVRDLSYFEGLR